MFFIGDKVVMKTKICVICGQEFEPTHFNQTRCKRPHFKQCLVCGKDMPWTEYDRCCSKECTQKHRKATCLEKYGVEWATQSEAIKEKTAQTCLEHYGVRAPAQDKEIRRKQAEAYDKHFGKETNPEGYRDKQERSIQTSMARYGTANPMQSDEIKKKAIASNIEKYGYVNAGMSPEVQAKMKATMLERYGVENCMQSPEIIEKARIAHKKKYGVDWHFQRPEVKDKIQNTNLAKYGVPWYCMTDECKKASGKIISKLNLQWVAKLSDEGIETEQEFYLASKSFDIKVNDSNILIEIDPTFTHNCLYNPFDHNDKGLPQDYHIAKTKVAKDHGYRCIHVFDWDDPDKVIELLKTRKISYARQLNLVTLTESECDEFLIQNHLQNSCKGQSVRIGLKNSDGQLLQVMTFGEPRYNKNYQWELLRLCSAHGYAVTGGSSRLFNYFIANYRPESIISYCDISKFDGKVYDSLGFRLNHVAEPAKIWFKDGKKITDNLLRQRGYDQLFNTSYGKGTSNEQLMIDHGWLPIYDCGQYVYEWRNS